MERALWWSVPVPAELISDKLSPESRALYMIARDLADADGHCDFDTVILRCALTDRQTILSHLRSLAKAGWLTVDTFRRGKPPLLRITRQRSDQPAIRVPGYLIHLSDVPLGARLLYATLVKLRGDRGGPVCLSQHELAAHAVIGSRTTVRAWTAQLQRTGWLAFTRRRGSAGSSTYVPLDPHRSRREARARDVHMRIAQASFKGEAILREFLNVAVDDDHYIDNAWPGAIVNPLTDHLLQFDRLYPRADVAIEFNGPQHYRTTKLFADQAQVTQQRLRDLIKAGQAAQHGIQLIVIKYTELVPDVIVRKLEPYLPLRQLRAGDPVMQLLYKQCRDYVRNAQRATWADESGATVLSDRTKAIKGY